MGIFFRRHLAPDSISFLDLEEGRIKETDQMQISPW